MCNHDNAYWYPATNEDGWKCLDCNTKPGEPPGFCPELDRRLITVKVSSILMDFHESKLIYISNNDEADFISACVADACEKAGKYDQYFILAEILKQCQPSHSKYWKKVSDGILKGKDPRDRCHCGALATSSSSSNGTWVHTCSKHHSWTGITEEPVT